jgi:hypothetical protein
MNSFVQYCQNNSECQQEKHLLFYGKFFLSTNWIEDNLFLTKTNETIIDKILLSLQLILHNIVSKIKIEK